MTSQLKQEALTNYLTTATADWDRPTDGHPHRSPHLPVVSARYRANQFLDDADFLSLNLGTIISVPDLEVVVGSVRLVAPLLHPEDVDTLVDAIMMAASDQQDDKREAAIVISAVVVIISAVITFLRIRRQN